MPYSKAHWFMLALLPVTLLAFWPSYFGILREAPLAHHLHGVTGTLWILLIAGQSFAIHSRRLPLHRAAGRLVFALAPLLIGAFSLVTWAGAQKSAVQHPFYEAFGRALLTGDALLVFATALLVYLALRYRRQFHPTGFEIQRVVDLAGRFKGSNTFIEDARRELPRFYKEVVQNVVNWVPRAPKYKEETPAEPGIAMLADTLTTAIEPQTALDGPRVLATATLDPDEVT